MLYAAEYKLISARAENRAPQVQKNLQSTGVSEIDPYPIIDGYFVSIHIGMVGVGLGGQVLNALRRMKSMGHGPAGKPL